MIRREGLRESVSFDAGRCWKGRCDINPTRPVPLAGYAGVERLSEADAEGLEANWVVFPTDDAAIVLVLAIDALFSSDAFETTVTEALAGRGIIVAALWVVASHTHFAPQLDPNKPKLGCHDPRHMAEVAQRIAEAIRLSLDSPAHVISEMHYGKSLAPGAVNRRRSGWKLQKKPPFMKRMAIPAPAPDAAICRDLRLWVMYDTSGIAQAAFVHWSCHTVASHPRNRVSPAHVGAIRAALRDGLAPALPVISMTGCSGDIRPDFRAPLWSRRSIAPYPFQPGFAPPTPERVRRFEARIFDAARCAALQTTALPKVESGLLAQTSAELLQGVPLIVTRLMIGPLNFFGINCEPSHDWVPQLGFEHDAPDHAVTGYVGEVFGYLPTEAQISAGGYEVDGFRNAFGFRGDWRQIRAMRSRVTDAFASLWMP